MGQVCVYYCRGCQHLWAGPLHSHHILLRGYRLLVPSRPGLITYCIQVQSHFIPFTVYDSVPPGQAVMEHDNCLGWQRRKMGRQAFEWKKEYFCSGAEKEKGYCYRCLLNPDHDHVGMHCIQKGQDMGSVSLMGLCLSCAGLCWEMRDY